MSEQIKSNYWRDVLHIVYQKDEVPESVRKENGIIALTNYDGTVVYPTFQFIPESDYKPIPLIARAWQLITLIGIEPLGFPEWDEAAKMLIPHEALSKRSYVDILSKKVVLKDDIKKIDDIIIGFASNDARTNGVDFELPKEFHPNYQKGSRFVKNY